MSVLINKLVGVINQTTKSWDLSEEESKQFSDYLVRGFLLRLLAKYSQVSEKPVAELIEGFGDDLSADETKQIIEKVIEEIVVKDKEGEAYLEKELEVLVKELNLKTNQSV